MKFNLYGKVISRTCRKFKKHDGSVCDVYEMVIEEPGKIPSPFKVSSMDASLFGQTDGPCGVGKMVNASGFVNGKAYERQTSDGKKFTAYSAYFTLNSLQPYNPETSNHPTIQPSEEVADDVPF